MAETSGDDRLHVRLEWPADDQRAPARPRSPRAAPKKAAASAPPSPGPARKTGAAAPRTSATAKKNAPPNVEPTEHVPPSPSPRRARPLQATTRRPRRTVGSGASDAESAVVLPGKPSSAVRRIADPALANSLPAVADRVDALTHALISLHSLVSDRLSDQSAQIMDVIDGSMATLARRGDEHTVTIEDLAAQVRALREGQGELVSALTELLARSETPPADPADPRETPSVSPLRRRVSRWLSGAADSVGAPRSPGG